MKRAASLSAHRLSLSSQADPCDVVKLATVGTRQDPSADDFVPAAEKSAVHLPVVFFGAPKLPASEHLLALHRKGFLVLCCLELHYQTPQIAVVLILYPEGTLVSL
jgi:hypothetical protein